MIGARYPARLAASMSLWIGLVVFCEYWLTISGVSCTSSISLSRSGSSITGAGRSPAPRSLGSAYLVGSVLRDTRPVSRQARPSAPVYMASAVVTVPRGASFTSVIPPVTVISSPILGRSWITSHCTMFTPPEDGMPFRTCSSIAMVMKHAGSKPPPNTAGSVPQMRIRRFSSSGSGV